jgi:hypothetical protein
MGTRSCPDSRHIVYMTVLSHHTKEGIQLRSYISIPGVATNHLDSAPLALEASSSRLVMAPPGAPNGVLTLNLKHCHWGSSSGSTSLMVRESHLQGNTREHCPSLNPPTPSS